MPEDSDSDQPEETTGRRQPVRPIRPRDAASENARRQLERARSISTPEDAKAMYAQWASEYDRDVFGSLKIVGPAVLARHCVRHVSADAAILDAGCGTGVVASHLRAAGYEVVDGMDFSSEMLAVAANKGVYRQLMEADLQVGLDLGDGSYDAVVSAGTFVSGHVTADALYELCRVVRSGGHLLFNVMPAFWEPGGFEGVLTALAERGTASVVVDQVEPITVDETQMARTIVLTRD